MESFAMTMNFFASGCWQNSSVWLKVVVVYILMFSNVRWLYLAIYLHNFTHSYCSFYLWFKLERSWLQRPLAVPRYRHGCFRCLWMALMVLGLVGAPLFRPLDPLDLGDRFWRLWELLMWRFPIHGGTPIVGWFLSWKIRSRNGWWLGVALF